MKGILLAGGAGTRLHPATLAVAKPLLPVYDKPLVYYALSGLMRAGVREILVISAPRDLESLRRLLGDGAAWGVSFAFAEQPRPEGIAQALTIGRPFAAGSAVALALGDNVFHGPAFEAAAGRLVDHARGCVVLACRVADAGRFGVVAFDASGRALSIEEKPAQPKSDWAVAGFYAFDARAVDEAAALKPSSRGELEITDVAAAYLRRGELRVERLEGDGAWFDVGTPEALHEASTFVRERQARDGVLVGSPEATAFAMGWCPRATLDAASRAMAGTTYGAALARLARAATTERR